MSSFKAAYGGGWRAGMANRTTIILPNGTKVLAKPEYPYTKRRHFIHRLCWEQGYYNGSLESLNRWLRNGRAV